MNDKEESDARVLALAREILLNRNKQAPEIAPMSVCICDVGERAQYPFKRGERLLFFGEIANMPGHCVVVNRAGKVLWGYHTENFRLPTEDEL